MVGHEPERAPLEELPCYRELLQEPYLTSGRSDGYRILTAHFAVKKMRNHLPGTIEAAS